jgi:hypothetical protein
MGLEDLLIALYGELWTKPTINYEGKSNLLTFAFIRLL